MRTILDHEKNLKKDVFFTDSKWPHFELLFNDLKKLSKKVKKTGIVISLERTNLYGGSSLFAPFFKKGVFISVDCTSKKLLKRGQYNKKLLSNKKIIKRQSDFHINYKNIKLKNNYADHILIPNLMHHIDDPNYLLKKSFKLLKKKGKLYIFEPLVRELHQIPEDYGRFTPFSLKKILTEIGYKKFKYNLIGGPFTSMYYYFDQSLEYLPKKIKTNYIKNFNNKLYELVKLEKKYNKNLIRKNSKAPVAFSISAEK